MLDLAMKVREMALPMPTTLVLPHSNLPADSVFFHPTVVVGVKEQPSSNRRGIDLHRDSSPQECGSNTSMLVPPTAVELAAHTPSLVAVVRLVVNRDSTDSCNTGVKVPTIPDPIPNQLPVPNPSPRHAHRHHVHRHLDKLVQTRYSSKALLQLPTKYEEFFSYEPPRTFP